MNPIGFKVLEYFSRKFVLSGAALIGCFVLAIQEKEMAQWVMGMGTVLTLYITGNVAQTHVEKRKAPPANSQVNVEEGTVIVEAESSDGKRDLS
jgi:hypothetical protein